MNEPLISKEISTEVCEDFKKSLICTLSLSSKELFHSNMIGWLIENNLDFARNILNRPELDSEIKVEREKYNFDLFVTVNEEKYVIENKVKSLPDYQQLQGYKEKMDSKKESNTNYILLSLIDPGLEFRKKDSFIRVVSYEDVVKWISNVKTDDFYLSAILQDYVKLINTLMHVKEVSAHLREDEALTFSPSDEASLREIRLFDVAQKIRYSCFEALCHDRLRVHELYDRLNITVGMSMSMGRIGIDIKVQKHQEIIPLFLGIEIQGNHYRLFVRCIEGAKDKKIVIHVAESLRQQGVWLLSSDKEILKFGEEFKYSYVTIKGKTVGDLLVDIENDLKRIFSNLNKIEDVIDKLFDLHP